VKIIIGGIFKRYVRLLIPVMAIFPFYVAIKTLDKNDIYEKCSKKYLSEFLLDMIYGTWLNKSGYTYAAWTLPHELFCSYFAFQIAFIVTNINHRWIAYLSVFLFMLEPIV